MDKKITLNYEQMPLLRNETINRISVRITSRSVKVIDALIEVDEEEFGDEKVFPVTIHDTL